MPTCSAFHCNQVYKLQVFADEIWGPPSSEYGTCMTVKARFWLFCFQVKVVKTFAQWFQGHSLALEPTHSLRANAGTAVERIWHIHHSQGQMLALAFRQKSLTPWKLFPLRPEADLSDPWVWRFGGYFRLLNMMHAPTTPPLKMNCLDTSEPRSHDYGASPSAPSC